MRLLRVGSRDGPECGAPAGCRLRGRRRGRAHGADPRAVSPIMEAFGGDPRMPGRLRAGDSPRGVRRERVHVFQPGGAVSSRALR